jgi:hypothetical protein
VTQELQHPYTVSDLCWAQGSQHTLRSEMQRREKRGEVAVAWRHARMVLPGVLRIPYIRLRSQAAVRRRAALRVAGWLVIGAAALSGFLMALWEARFIILGALLLAASVLVAMRVLAHRPGCVGLHCPGCKG